MVKLAAVATALIAAAPAWAQAGRTAEFSVGTVNYVLPIPDGYCLPSTDIQRQAEAYGASLDKDNQTSLTLFSCGPKADQMDYILIKTPYALLNTPMTRATVLSDPYFAKPQAREAVPDVERRLESSLSEVSGKDVEISSAVGGEGHDDVCGYVGGSMKAVIGEVKMLSLGGCMSAVGDRAIVVFSYAPGADPGTPKRLMQRSRDVVLAIRVKR